MRRLLISRWFPKASTVWDGICDIRVGHKPLELTLGYSKGTAAKSEKAQTLPGSDGISSSSNIRVAAYPGVSAIESHKPTYHEGCHRSLSGAREA
jgi:hypothetical protein